MKRLVVIFLCALSLAGCKPKDEPVEPTPVQEKTEYLDWSKRIAFGEGIIRQELGTYADNIRFDSFYKYVGENDGYVCGKVQWIDTYRQKRKDNYFYVYLSFENGRVSKDGKPMVIERGQDYPMEKYNMFCSLN